MHLGDQRLARPLALLLALAVLALAAGGCGGGSTGSGTTTPTASAPDATAPPPDATQPGTGTTPPATTTQPAQTQPSTQPARGGGRSGNDGGGGRHVRVPAAFEVVNGRLHPRTITVPAFLAIQMSLRVHDTIGHHISIGPPVRARVDVIPGERTGSVLVSGQRPGRYRILYDYQPAGTLVVGGEPGP
jgi:hypothetical protein